MLKQLLRKLTGEKKVEVSPPLKDVDEACALPPEDKDEDLALPEEVPSAKEDSLDRFFPHEYSHIRLYQDLDCVGGSAMTVKFSPHENSPHLTKISVSVCSEEDNFCRAFGRNKAQERLEKGNYLVVSRRDVSAGLIFSGLSGAGSSPQENLTRTLMYLLQAGAYTEGPEWDFAPMEYFFRSIGLPLSFTEVEAA